MMAAPSLSDKQEDLNLEERAAFLSAAPRSGELSPFAQKLAAEAFVWLCSIVVFGSSADLAREAKRCNAMCGFDIAAGVISFVFLSVLLIGHYLMWTNTIDRSSWLTSAAEMRILTMFSIWWIFGAAVASAIPSIDVNTLVPPDADAADAAAVPATAVVALGAGSVHATGVTIVFAWLCLFGSIFGAYKAYHASKEEQKSLHYAQVMSMQATEEEEYANFS